MTNPFAPELMIESHDSVRVLTLNRPDALNAANEKLHQALIDVWAHLAADTDARAVVITGAGKAFSAGGDLEHIAAMWTDREMRKSDMDGAARLVREMLRFPLPVVAAVNGPAVGLGSSLAVCSDIVLVERSAYFADTHVVVGLTAADGGAALWPMVMSMMRAKEYLLTGERIPASVAVEIGLANRVVEDGTVVNEAVALAQKLAATPPQAVRSTKRALNMHLQRAVTDVLEYALSEEYASFDTPEHQAIVTTFLKRKRR